MTKTINYETLAQNLLDCMCELKGCGDTCLWLLQMRYSNQDLKELQFCDDDIQYANENYGHQYKYQDGNVLIYGSKNEILSYLRDIDIFNNSDEFLWYTQGKYWGDLRWQKINN